MSRRLPARTIPEVNGWFQAAAIAFTARSVQLVMSFERQPFDGVSKTAPQCPVVATAHPGGQAQRLMACRSAYDEQEPHIRSQIISGRQR